MVSWRLEGWVLRTGVLGRGRDITGVDGPLTEQAGLSVRGSVSTIRTAKRCFAF